MQPLVGVITDRSTSKWGRRRPFMIAGSFIVGLCLLVLGWASEIVGIFITDEDSVCMGSYYCIISSNRIWFRKGILDSSKGARLREEGKMVLVLAFQALYANTEQKKTLTIALAVLGIYAVDFAINIGTLSVTHS